MALTASEEALVRQLLAQQAAILSLAGNEATISSKLGATKVTLADLVAASALADADLLLTRQGTTDKSVRADILATYMAAELNLSSLAPKASPVFTGDPTAPTPAQFDNDVSLATTAFVQRALGNFAGVESATGTLGPTSAGKRLVASGGSVTLPLTSSVPLGASISFFVYGAGPLVVNRQGGDVIAVGGGVANQTSMSISSGTEVTFVAESGVWEASGTGNLKNSLDFGRSFAGAGYQRLPSGLIVQWGTANPSAAYEDYALAITYPTAHLIAVCSARTALVTGAAHALSNTHVRIYTASAGAYSYNWFSLGY